MNGKVTFNQKDKVHKINIVTERGVAGSQTLNLFVMQLMFYIGRHKSPPFLSYANKSTNKFHHISIDTLLCVKRYWTSEIRK